MSDVIIFKNLKNGCMKIQPLKYTNFTLKTVKQVEKQTVKENKIPERLKMAGILSLPFIICEISCRISKKLNSRKS